MTKTVLFLVAISFVLTSCMNYPGNYLSIVEDSYKNEKIVKLEQSFHAKKVGSVFSQTEVKMDLSFEKNALADQQPILYFSMLMNLNRVVEDTFFINIRTLESSTNLRDTYRNKIFKRSFSDLQISETYIEPDRRDPDSIVPQDVLIGQLSTVKANALLNKKLTDRLANASEVTLRFYVDRIPYEIDLGDLKLENLQRFLKY